MKNFIMNLTYFRIISGPLIFCFSAFLDAFLLSFWIFIFAALTDYLDGMLARRFNLESDLGKILDPIADKILLVSSLFAIMIIANENFLNLVCLIIIIREFWVSGLREFSAKRFSDDITKVTYLAKIKTAVQFIGIATFFLTFAIQFQLGIFLSNFIIFMSMLITVKTGLDYTKNVLGHIKVS